MMNSISIGTGEKKMATMEYLCDSMACMRISRDNGENDLVEIAIKHDVMRLLRAYYSANCHLDAHVYLMPTQLTCMTMQRMFLSKYPNEAAFYKEIENRLLQHIPSSYLLDMMPLIDEYIEHVFTIFLR